MNLSETARLMAVVQSFNNRTVGEADVMAWQSVLDDVPLADAEEAVRRHYRGSSEWIMPAHIRRIVEQIELERARAVRKWAPGQAGVAPEDALPEIEGGAAAREAAIAGMPPELRALISDLLEAKGLSPQQARERLAPRREYWEREQRAYLRAHSGEPNPLYRPKADAYEVREGLPCPVCGKVIRGPWSITRGIGEATCEHGVDD